MEKNEANGTKRLKGQACVIAVLNIKGGCGKTMLSTNMAAHLAGEGFAVGLMDADPQRSAMNWLAVRELAVTLPLVDRLEIGVENDLRASVKPYLGGHDFIVIDAGGRLNPYLLAATTVADVLMIPLIPSKSDIDGTKEYLGLVVNEIAELKRSAAKEMAVVFVVNCFKQTTLHQQAMDVIGRLGYTVAETKLGHRIAYQDAQARGMGVLEYEPTGTAAAEISCLVQEEILTKVEL